MSVDPLRLRDDPSVPSALRDLLSRADASPARGHDVEGAVASLNAVIDARLGLPRPGASMSPAGGPAPPPERAARAPSPGGAAPTVGSAAAGAAIRRASPAAIVGGLLAAGVVALLVATGLRGPTAGGDAGSTETPAAVGTQGPRFDDTPDEGRDAASNVEDAVLGTPGLPALIEPANGAAPRQAPMLGMAAVSSGPPTAARARFGKRAVLGFDGRSRVAVVPIAGDGVGATDDPAAAELRQIAEVRAASGLRAVELADEGERRFPVGAFHQEREYLAIRALHDLGQSSAASRRGAAFLASSPGGLYAERIRKLITPPSPDGGSRPLSP